MLEIWIQECACTASTFPTKPSSQTSEKHILYMLSAVVIWIISAKATEKPDVHALVTKKVEGENTATKKIKNSSQYNLSIIRESPHLPHGAPAEHLTASWYIGTYLFWVSSNMDIQTSMSLGTYLPHCRCANQNILRTLDATPFHLDVSFHAKQCSFLKQCYWGIV